MEDLLRAYLIAVADELPDEVAQRVDSLRQSGVTLDEVLLAHSVATERLLVNIGSRSGWLSWGEANCWRTSWSCIFPQKRRRKA